MQLIPLRPAVVLPVSWVQYSMGATKGKSGGGRQLIVVSPQLSVVSCQYKAIHRTVTWHYRGCCHGKDRECNLYMDGSAF